MNYYIYQNWQAHGMSYTIHKWNCGYCHCGYGMHANIERGANGVWIGPFNTLQLARQYFVVIEVPGVQQHECNCCNN